MFSHATHAPNKMELKKFVSQQELMCILFLTAAF